MQAEKIKAQEYQQEIKKISDDKLAKENIIQELSDANELLKAKKIQETESMSKEIQKYQTNLEKIKQQYSLKASEWKESAEKLEKN